MRHRSYRSRIRFSLLIALIVIIVGYGFFEARGLIFGPQLTITKPQNGEGIASDVLVIEGKVLRSRELFMNGFPITWNEQGIFKETTLVAPGRNIFTFEVTDKFGRTKATVLEVYRLKSE